MVVGKRKIYETGFDLIDTSTFPAGGVVPKDGWTPFQACFGVGGHWNLFRDTKDESMVGNNLSSPVSLTINYDLRLCAGIQRDLTISDSDGVFEVEFAFSMSHQNAPNPWPQIQPFIRIKVQEGSGGFPQTARMVLFQIDDLMEWLGTVKTYRGPSIKISTHADFNGGPTSAWLFRYETPTSNSEPVMLTLPAEGETVWNAVRYRIQQGIKARVWVNRGLYGFWIETFDNVGSDVVFPVHTYSYTKLQLYIAGQSFITEVPAIDIDYAIDNLKVFDNVDPTFTNVITGMVDEDGLVLMGYDPDDDGSGESSGGGDGLGGAGDGGIDTGGSGLVGSGSEGNFDDPTTDFGAGVGGASAWRGSGTGINILRWKYTKIQEGFGFAEVDLSIVDSWNRALSELTGRNFNLVVDRVIVFRGFVKEIHENDQVRYSGTLILEHVYNVMQRWETELNFALPITTTLDINDTIKSLTATTITLKNGFLTAVPTDSTYAVLIVPGDEPAISNENFNDLITVGVDGVIDNVNTDNDERLFIQGIDTGDSIEISGIYSGTRSEVNAINFQFKVKLRSILVFVQTIHIDIYDYIAVGYVDDFITHRVAGGYGLGNTAKIFLSPITPIGTNPQNYIKPGAPDANQFKFRVRLTRDQGTTELNLSIYFADVIIFTDPIYDGTSFPITGKSASKPFGFIDTVTVSENPITAGLSIGDTVVLGMRNDLVLSFLATEFFADFQVDIGTGFVNFTASQFKENNYTNYDAILSVLKKDTGVFYFRDDINTLVFRKRDNMEDTGVILSDDPAVGVPVEFLNHQQKQSDQYLYIQVTGAKYKIYDGEKQIRATSGKLGAQNNRILRINDPTLNSVTEAKDRINSELALLDLNNQPVHALNLDTSRKSFEIDLSTLAPGRLVDVKRKTFGSDPNYTGVPIRMINVNYDGYNKLRVNLQLGWKGTTFLDREIESKNESKRIGRATFRAMNTRPDGNLGGNEITTHRHSGYTERQNTEAITTVSTGSSVELAVTPETKIGMSITPNDNTGTFTSATVRLLASLNDTDFAVILTFILDTAEEYADFSWYPKYHTDYDYSEGTDRQTQTIYIKYDVKAISLVGDADIDISLLQSQ